MLTEVQKAILQCPECGHALHRGPEYWGCPRLHGKLKADGYIFSQLFPVQRYQDAVDFISRTEFMKKLRKASDLNLIPHKADNAQGT